MIRDALAELFLVHLEARWIRGNELSAIIEATAATVAETLIWVLVAFVLTAPVMLVVGWLLGSREAATRLKERKLWKLVGGYRERLRTLEDENARLAEDVSRLEEERLRVVVEQARSMRRRSG